MPSTSPHDKLYLKLRGKAYRLLGRREHSAWELRRKLQHAKHAEHPERAEHPEQAERAELVERLVAELTAEEVQSDFRFTEQHCRQRYQNGRGPVKVRYDLAQHRIEETLVERVMSGYETKWPALAAEVRCRKFGEQAPASYKDWARQARFLQQRGFTTEHFEFYAGESSGES